MKRAVISCVVLLFSAFLANAALILTDSFNYADGPLVSAIGSPWTTHSGTTGQVNVVSGRVFLTQTEGEDVNAPLSGGPYSVTTNVALYASFTLNVTNTPSGAGTYFAHFKDSGTSNFRDKLFVTTNGVTAGFYRVGVANSANTPAAILPTDLSFNTNYTVVTRYVVSNAVSTLWINPTSEIDTGVTDTTPAGVTISSFALRQSLSSGDGMGGLFFDNLLVGTSFPDVVSNAPPAPTITLPPQSQSAVEGSNVSFTASASGAAPIGFQWQFSPMSDAGVYWTNLPGATTSNLLLTSVTIGQSGFYSVVASNAIGTATSDSAVLNVFSSAAPAVSLMTYNLHGNGTTNWSTNATHVKAIGRQVQYLDPDLMTFQEIPVTNNGTAQMTNFTAVFRPGFYLATNSADDGFIHSAILSRWPIVASRSWLHDSDLTPYGYTNANHFYTRDLFEAEISVPGFPQPLHVFTVHLKSGGSSSDDAAKRAAEASAVSNFFVTIYLTTNALCPYLLTGDMNEDIDNPSTGSQQPIQRMISAPTGLQFTEPINPFTLSELTFSIQAPPPTKRYDYILPCGLLSSNITASQVFRTDLLTNPPPPLPLLTSDDSTASDHLPVLMTFANPYVRAFRLLSITRNNPALSLVWESVPGQSYRVENSSNLTSWTTFADNLLGTNGSLTLNTNATGNPGFFRVRRLP